MPTRTPILGLYNPEDPDDANTAVRVWRTADNLILDDAVLASAWPGQTLLANGSMDVWQRGAGPFTANGVMSADRWSLNLGGSSTLSVVQNTAQADAASRYCAACTYVHNAQSYLQQILEDYWQLRGRVLTLSMRVRTATASAVRIAIYDGTTFTYSGYHSGSGVYETLTVTATPAAAATAVRVMVVFGASSTVYLDAATLAVGSGALAYAPLHPQQELDRCQRYYREIGGLDVNEFAAMLQCFSATQALGLVAFPVEMALAPTITLSAVADWGVYSAAGSVLACTALTFSQITRRSARVDATVASGLVAGNAATLLARATAAARIKLEANPP